MRKIIWCIESLSSLVGKLASFLIVVLALCICYDVTTRYLFNIANFWPYDVTYMLYGSHAMIGAAYTLYHGTHVRMDLFYRVLDKRKKAIVDSICYVVIFFPLFLVLIWFFGEDTLWSLVRGERASSSIWRPQIAPFKAALTFGFILLLLQGFAEFIKALYTAVKGEDYVS